MSINSRSSIAMFHYEEVVCFVAENGVLTTQRVDAMSLQWLSEIQT